MAAVSITAANVLPSSAATPQSGIAAATITQGQALYADASAGYGLKLTTTASSAAAACVGLAMNAASSGQRVDYCSKDPNFTPGFTALAGDDVWLFDTTAGALTVTKADLEAGDYVTHLGVMLTTTTMNLNITPGGLIA